MGAKGKSFTEACAQILTAGCDREHLPSNRIIVRDTLSCHDNYLCQIIFKSYYA